MRNAYARPVISQVPRLLSHMDRNRFSPTYGCCTRDFWHYRLLDIPNSQTQAMALTLALIYKKKYPGGDPYFNNRHVKDWAIACMLYWAKIQHKSGSFDEVYKNQDSYAATAFTTYAVSEAIILFDDIKEKRVILNALKKAALWLSRNNETIAMNQVMVSLIAIYFTAGLVFLWMVEGVHVDCAIEEGPQQKRIHMHAIVNVAHRSRLQYATFYLQRPPDYFEIVGAMDITIVTSDRLKLFDSLLDINSHTVCTGAINKKSER